MVTTTRGRTPGTHPGDAPHGVRNFMESRAAAALNGFLTDSRETP
jgi:hypothetical protein